MQQISDPYRALGVARAATDAEIKAAHRKLVKRYHPDTGSKSDTERFLRVQDAYRVLSDPLLRKEWDQKHAPGPMRADRPDTATPRQRRPPAARQDAGPAETPPPPRREPPAPDASAREPDPRARPRSSRAYTWSASEVPWWEEARRKAADEAPPAPTDAAAENERKPDEPVFTQQDFDVYNRSSGAAWSMAARAYFRKGDAELPRRGSFRHEGTQVVTGGRARSAAEAEARRRAAAAATVAGAEATFAHPTPPPKTREGTTHIVRRAIVAPWPSLSQRFGYAFLAWLPLVLTFGVLLGDTLDYALASLVTGVGLGCLVCLPRIAYVGALATMLVGIIGGLFIGGLAVAGRLPSVEGLTMFAAGLFVVGFVATAAVVVLGPQTLRPWSASR